MVGNNCKSNARSGRKKSKHLPPSTKPSKAGLSFRRTRIAPTRFNGRHGSSPSSADGPATPRIGHPDQSPSTTEWLASKSSSLAEPSKMCRNTSDETVAALLRFALIKPETVADERDPTITTGCTRLHRRVRHVAAARREGELREGAQRVLVEALVAAYPENIWRDPHTGPLSRRLDSLALAPVGDDATVPKGVEQRTAKLLDCAGQYRHHVL